MTTESITPPWDPASAGGDGRSGARSSALRRQRARDQPLWRGPGFGDVRGQRGYPPIGWGQQSGRPRVRRLRVPLVREGGSLADPLDGLTGPCPSPQAGRRNGVQNRGAACVEPRRWRSTSCPGRARGRICRRRTRPPAQRVDDRRSASVLVGWKQLQLVLTLLVALALLSVARRALGDLLPVGRGHWALRLR
jgi:hypothetical protein